MLGSKYCYITHSRMESDFQAAMMIDVLESTWGPNKVFGGVYEALMLLGSFCLLWLKCFDRITRTKFEKFEWPFRCLDEATKLHHNCKTSPFSVFFINILFHAMRGRELANILESKFFKSNCSKKTKYCSSSI